MDCMQICMHVCIQAMYVSRMYVSMYVSRQMDTLIARQSYTHAALAIKIVALTIGNIGN